MPASPSSGREDSVDSSRENDATASIPISSRRAFIGIAASAGAVLAGCSSGGGDQRGPPVPHQTPQSTAGPSGESFLVDAHNFHGYADYTDTAEVSVAVGVSGESATGERYEHAFDPAGVMITEGTRVVWEWADVEGPHGVTALDESFESDLSDEPGHTFARTFQQSDIHRYYCPEHRAAGMKGAVLVQKR